MRQAERMELQCSQESGASNAKPQVVAESRSWGGLNGESKMIIATNDHGGFLK